MAGVVDLGATETDEVIPLAMIKIVIPVKILIPANISQGRPSSKLSFQNSKSLTFCLATAQCVVSNNLAYIYSPKANNNNGLSVSIKNSSVYSVS
jgi:hypothetical protein